MREPGRRAKYGRRRTGACVQPVNGDHLGRTASRRSEGPRRRTYRANCLRGRPRRRPRPRGPAGRGTGKGVPTRSPTRFAESNRDGARPGILSTCTVTGTLPLVLNRLLNYRNVLLTEHPGGEVGYLLSSGERRFVPRLAFIERSEAWALDDARPVRLVDITRVGMAGWPAPAWPEVRPGECVHCSPDGSRGVRHLRCRGRTGGGRGAGDLARDCASFAP